MLTPVVIDFLCSCGLFTSRSDILEPAAFSSRPLSPKLRNPSLWPTPVKKKKQSRPPALLRQRGVKWTCSTWNQRTLPFLLWECCVDVRWDECVAWKEWPAFLNQAGGGGRELMETVYSSASICANANIAGTLEFIAFYLLWLLALYCIYYVSVCWFQT